MKFHWLFSRRNTRAASAPSAAIALPRIRALRDQAEWKPLVDQEAIEKREARVEAERRRLVYHPLEHKIEPAPTETPKRSEPVFTPFIYAVCISVVAVSVGSAFWKIASSFSPKAATEFRGDKADFALENQPVFLSDQMALELARQTLVRCAFHPDNWVPLKVDEAIATTAPDGLRDVYLMRTLLDGTNSGAIMFKSLQTGETGYSVNITVKGKLAVAYITHGK